MKHFEGREKNLCKLFLSTDSVLHFFLSYRNINLEAQNVVLMQDYNFSLTGSLLQIASALTSLKHRIVPQDAGKKFNLIAHNLGKKKNY